MKILILVLHRDVTRGVVIMIYHYRRSELNSFIKRAGFVGLSTYFDLLKTAVFLFIFMYL